MVIYWWPDQYCPGSFADVYEPFCEVRIEYSAGPEFSCDQDGIINSSIMTPWCFFNNYLTVCKQFQLPTLDNELFYRAVVGLADVFVPKTAIASEIQRNLDKLGQNFIGLHVRRTDIGNCKEHQPASNETWFKTLDGKTDKLFLATDDGAVLSSFCSHFGSRLIHSNAIYLNAYRQTDLSAAVTDLHTLRHAAEIFGTHYSSFTNFATWLNPKATLQIVHD